MSAVSATREIIVAAFTVFLATSTSTRSANAIGIFMGLGSGPIGYQSLAYAISADGSTVAGITRTGSSPYPFRWTEATGVVRLPAEGGVGVFKGGAMGTSADGSVVVGFADNGTTEAFRWTAQDGTTLLGHLPSRGFHSIAVDVSSDGMVVVGTSDSKAPPSAGVAEVNEAFIWTPNAGMVGIGDLPGGLASQGSDASAVSADGLVVVGSGHSDSGQEAFLWTEASGIIGLGDLEGGSFESRAIDVSADGSVVVGWGTSESGVEAFLRTADGMMGLGDLLGGAFGSVATSISWDGKIVVGVASTELGWEPFIWDSALGMRKLSSVLSQDYGLDLSGWTLASAEISADASAITGWGVNPGGDTEAWIAVLPSAVPEPSSRLLTLLCLMVSEDVIPEA